MPKAPEPSSTCQKTTKSLPRISPKSYCYNAVPNRFLAHFSTSRTNGPRLLSRAKAGTHSPSPTGSHTAAYTAKQGRFRWGRYYYPRTVLHVSETLRGQGGRTANFAAFGSWSEALLKDTKSLRDSDVLMRIAVPLALCVLWEYTRPRPKSGKVCRSDTRPRRVSEPRKTLRG